ncbi:MAG: 3-deoxy-8-phosphooctulonate synthase [Candidatus Caenarcaniphilales bacterium]|nr:3-deoxy-8-phosphooctulonate synthase [Candidatus Caenarcaniphilales bacterium]
MEKDSFPLLLGPCVIESRDNVMRIAEEIKKISDELHESGLGRGVIVTFKASFDKANRSSIKGFRGPGIDEGLKILDEVREEFGLPIVSDVHTEEQAKQAGEVLDMLQLPAFLCRQTDLVVAAAETGKVLNIKKGQFMSPPEVKNIADKCKEAGNEKLFICERGNSFGYNNLVVDMRMFEQVREMGIRTIFDATHSCQLPGAGGDKSLGNSHYAPILARAAVAAGATGLFAETHFNPEEALSDGPNMIPLAKLKSALVDVLTVRQALNKDLVKV